MAKLPPVRRRESYADVSADELAFAILHDRLIGDPAPGDDAAPPPREDVAPPPPAPVASDRLRAAIVAALDEVEAMAASVAMLAEIPDAERAAIMLIADDLLLGAANAAADVELDLQGDGAVLAALPGADWLIPFTDDGIAIQVGDPSTWLRQADEAPMTKGDSIKRPDVYRALRRQGYDKSKAAAIANATAAGTVDHTRKCDDLTVAPPVSPDYRPATDPRASCGTCQAFLAADDGVGHCAWFDAPTTTAYTCDDWDYAPATGAVSSLDIDKAKEREYQRAEDGKFGEGQGSSGKGKTEAKPKDKDPPSKQDDAAVAAGLDPRDAAVLADPELVDELSTEDAERLSAAGLLQRGDDGSYYPTDLGERLGTMVAEGDAAGAADAVATAAAEYKEQQSSAAESKKPAESEAADAAAGGEAKPEPASGGGGGGGGGGGSGEALKAPDNEQLMSIRDAVSSADREANAASVADAVGMDSNLLGALTEIADPEEGIQMNPQNQAQLEAMGLVESHNGQSRPSEAGRLLIAAAYSNDPSSAERALVASGAKPPATKLYKRAAGPLPAAWSFAIAKVDGEQRIVEGYASSEALDGQPGIWKGVQYEGDVVDAASINAALPDYLQYANIREMHAPSAVGVALEARVIPGEVRVTLGGAERVLKNPLYLVVKVVDDAAWNKVKAGVYKGFSIGGGVADAVVTRMGGRLVRLIKALQLTEISLVDRPANPDARIVLWKAHGLSPSTGGAMPPIPTNVTLAAFREALAAEGLTLTKAADSSKVVALIQQLRNDAELSGDVEAAQMYTQAITLVMQAGGDAEPATDGATAPETLAPEGDVTTETEEIAQGARTRGLRKAGRVMAAARMEKMKPVVKSLLALMADAGDTQAAKALKAYEDADITPPGEEAGAAIGKAVGVELSQHLGTLTTGLAKIQHDQAALAGVVDALSRVARGGGPAARPVAVEKRLGTDPAQPARPGVQPVDQAELAEIKRLALTEPDQRKRAHYQTRYAALTGEIIG